MSYVATLMSYVATLMSYVATLMSYVAVVEKNCLYLINYDGLLCFVSFVTILSFVCINIHCFVSFAIILSFVSIFWFGLVKSTPTV